MRRSNRFSNSAFFERAVTTAIVTPTTLADVPLDVDRRAEMGPPKGDTQGMRSIASFFAPKTNVVAQNADARPEKDARANRPASDLATHLPTPGKAAKTSEDAAPGATARASAAAVVVAAVVVEDPAPAAPSTVSAKKASDVKRRVSDAPSTDLPVSGAEPAEDVGRRVAVWWKSERRFFAGRVAAVDARRGKHHVRYDDGDDEWITVAKHRVCWDADADAVADDARARAATPQRMCRTKGICRTKTKTCPTSDRHAAEAYASPRVAPPPTPPSPTRARRGDPRAQKAAGKRKVVLSDSDEDFDDDAAEEEEEEESESEFDVESEASESDDEEEEEASESESYGAAKNRARAGRKTKDTVVNREKAAAPAPAAAATTKPTATRSPAAIPRVVGDRAPGAAKSVAARMDATPAPAGAPWRRWRAPDPRNTRRASVVCFRGWRRRAAATLPGDAPASPDTIPPRCDSHPGSPSAWTRTGNRSRCLPGKRSGGDSRRRISTRW